VRGRKLGSGTLSVSKIGRIIELTKQGISRNCIAKELGVCAKTIWAYQNKYVRNIY